MKKLKKFASRNTNVFIDGKTIIKKDAKGRIVTSKVLKKFENLEMLLIESEHQRTKFYILLNKVKIYTSYEKRCAEKYYKNILGALDTENRKAIKKRNNIKDKTELNASSEYKLYKVTRFRGYDAYTIERNGKQIKIDTGQHLVEKAFNKLIEK